MRHGGLVLAILDNVHGPQQRGPIIFTQSFLRIAHGYWNRSTCSFFQVLQMKPIGFIFANDTVFSNKIIMPTAVMTTIECM